MTQDVALRLDEKVLTELRHRAVDAHMSLSAWITSVLEDRVRGDRGFGGARRRALERLDKGFGLGGVPATREELHSR